VAAAVLVELINCNDEEGVFLVSSFAIFAPHDVYVVVVRHGGSAPPSLPVGVERR